MNMFFIFCFCIAILLIILRYCKIKDYLKDKFAGNIIEYALLVGFALFVFFIIISIVTSMLDWTVGLSQDFFDMFK